MQNLLIKITSQETILGAIVVVEVFGQSTNHSDREAYEKRAKHDRMKNLAETGGKIQDLQTQVAKLKKERDTLLAEKDLLVIEKEDLKKICEENLARFKEVKRILIG